MKATPELGKVMQGFYEGLKSGDVGFVDSLLCRHTGVIGIGTDPDEWWVGHATLHDKMKTQMAEMGGSITIVGSDPIAYAEGPWVGWQIGPGSEWTTGRNHQSVLPPSSTKNTTHGNSFNSTALSACPTRR